MKNTPNNLHTKLTQETAHIRLSQDERVHMKERLVEYMAFKPIRAAATSQKPRTQTSAPSPFFADVWQLMKTRYIPTALMLTLIFSSGAAYAAEDSVPGETLYPLKVNVTEEIVSVFSLTQEAKATWDARRAERRLEEASTLVSRGELTDETSAQVNALFSLHADEVAKRAEDLEEKNPALAAEMSTRFESALEAQEAILVRLAVEGGEIEESARELASNIRAKVKAFARIRSDAEAEAMFSASTTEGEATTSPAALRMKAAAEEGLQEAYGLLTYSDTLEEERKERASAQLAVAEVRLQKGGAALEAGNTGEAYLYFKDAFSLVQKITRFVEAEATFNIDALAIEVLVDLSDDELAIVPASGLIVGANNENTDEVEASDVEEALAAQENAQAAEEKLRVQEEVWEQSDNQLADSIEERFTELKTNAQTLMVRAEVAFASDDFSDAIRFFNRAAVLFSEAAVLLNDSEDEEENPSDNPSEPSEEPVAQVSTLSSITYQFSGDIHTFIAVVEVPDTCTEVSGEATIAKSLPEQISLSFSTNKTPTTCVKSPQTKTVSVEANASKEAQLRGVTLDEEPVENLIEVLIWANPDVQISLIADSETDATTSEASLEVESASTASSTMFGRTLKKTLETIQAQLTPGNF